MSFSSQANSNFSLSLTSLASTNSTNSTNSATSITKKSSVKSSQEYRALRQQLFQLQSAHSSLKLVHEREMISNADKRAQLQGEINELKDQVDELKKDQVFILNSEKEALETIETLKREKESFQAGFNSQLKHLQESLDQERELRFSLESELTHLKLSEKSETADNFEFTELLNEWKEKVLALTNKNNFLEAELENIKQQQQSHLAINPSIRSDSTNEDLRQKILSTYVSLEAAQSVLAQRRAEADRLAQRIGNVKILEEKYRDALIRIKRLESAVSTNCVTSESRAHTPPSPNSSSASDLKLIQLTQELGSLKESLALASLNYSTVTSELEASKAESARIQSELEEARRNILKLQNNLKVKDSTISSLKEQLDSTVTLLTETLKKKK